MKPSGPSKCSTPSHTMSLKPQPSLWSKSNIPSFRVWNIYGYKVTSKSNRKLLHVLARLMTKLISHRIVVSVAMIPYVQHTMQPKYKPNWNIALLIVVFKFFVSHTQHTPCEKKKLIKIIPIVDKEKLEA